MNHRKTQNKIPWWEPKIGKGEHVLIKKVLESNFINQGPFTEILENKIAELLKVRHVLATTSGTVALFMALKALGVGKGDEVIVPDITYIATANAVSLCGADVVLVDVGDDLTLSPDSLERAITTKTKAVIPVHISGRSADMPAILAIAKRKKFFVVEDAAEAFFSKKGGKFLGTIGDAGAFSLSPNKTLTSGQGGLVVTNNSALYKRLRQLRNQGAENRLSGGDDQHPTLGFNFKFTDIQAAVALGQLQYLQKRVSRMKRIHEIYSEGLKGLKDIFVFKCETSKGEVPQWTDILVEDRVGLDNFLRLQNMDCRRFWLPMHSHSYYRRPAENFPNASKLSSKALWLPSAFTLSDKSVLSVVSEIKRFCG